MAFKMRASRYVEICFNVLKRKTKYRNQYPYNYGYYDGTYLYGDCWCFNPKAILCAEAIGEPIDTFYTQGKEAVDRRYFQGAKASGCPDETGDYIMAKFCTPVSFAQMLKAKKAPALLLITGQHMGAYIGEFTQNGKTYNACEFTPNTALGNGLCPSYVDEDGARKTHKYGAILGYWNQAGYLTGFLDYDEQPTPKPEPGEFKPGDQGLDFCYHQGNVDFGKLKNAGIKFIIPRDGWGEDNLDPALVDYVKGAKVAGISVPGVYHFVYAENLYKVQQNARRAIANVQAAGLPKDTVIWCDIEDDTVKDAAKDYRGNTKLTNADLKRFAEVFCAEIQAAGYPTGVYTNQAYMKYVYGEDFGRYYDLWLADYEGALGYDCLIRQTGGNAQVPGISSGADTNTWIGTYTAGTARTKKKEDDKEQMDALSLALLLYAGKETEQTAKEKYGDNVYKNAETKLESIKENLRTQKRYINIAKKILSGAYGNNPERKQYIETRYGAEAYQKAQSYVNDIIGKKITTEELTKSYTVARQILKMKFGNGQERKDRITKKHGAEVYRIAQNIVNFVL